MSEEENEKSGATQLEKKDGVVLRIAWNDPGPAVFANHVLAFSDDGMLHLGFYQVVSPLVLGNTEEERKQAIEVLEQRGIVEGKLIAHIALPLPKLASVLQVLAKQAEKNAV